MHLTIEMDDPQGVFFDEIKRPGITQASVALTYAFIIVQLGNEADWPAVNAKICQRWKGKSALKHIKNLAWEQVETWKQSGANRPNPAPPTNPTPCPKS